MPSIFEAVRDRFRSGLSAFDEPGPEIVVRPFGPGEVTAPAGVLKSVMSIAAHRQARSNYRAAAEQRALAMEHDRLQTEALRAKLGEPRYTVNGYGGLTGAEALLAEDRAADNARAGEPKPEEMVVLLPGDEKFYGLSGGVDRRYPKSMYEAAKYRTTLTEASRRAAAAREHIGSVYRQALGPVTAAGEQLTIERESQVAKLLAERESILNRTVLPAIANGAPGAIVEWGGKKVTAAQALGVHVQEDVDGNPIVTPEELQKAIASWRKKQEDRLRADWEAVPRNAMRRKAVSDKINDLAGLQAEVAGNPAFDAFMLGLDEKLSEATR